MCVCVWVGRLQWKCISCITFLFLIFHALWIYLNPLRWIEKEKKEKEEVRDMQNKKHPPLANVLPLSSLGFLIISSLFSSFTWGHFFWSHLPMLNPNHGHTVFEEGKQGSGREDDRLCVPDWNYGWSLRWWMDSFACFKPSTVEAKGWEGPEKYSDSLKERGGMWWMSNIGNGLVFFWFVSLSYVSRVNVAPSEQSHLKTRTQLKCAPNQTSTQTFFSWLKRVGRGYTGKLWIITICKNYS